MRKIIATGLLAGVIMGTLLGHVRAEEPKTPTLVHALLLANGKTLWVAALYTSEDKCAVAARVMNTSISTQRSSFLDASLGTGRCVAVVQP